MNSTRLVPAVMTYLAACFAALSPAFLAGADAMTLSAHTAGRAGVSGPDFGRRLEPEGRRVIHGAGQDTRTFVEYTRLMGEHPPVIYMSYLGLNVDPEARIRRIAQEIETAEAALDGKYRFIPQIGVSMTQDGKPQNRYEHRVAAGEYDHHIDALARALREWDRPVFLRIGYEFNGHWNGYEPETYRAAFRRVVERLREHGVEQAAAVWNWSPDEQDYLRFYPGDDVVDWWSLNLFNVAYFDEEPTRAFMADALERGYPVMIGESTPRRVGVGEGDEGGRKSVDTWYRPYFAFIERHPHVKAFCYINWDWSRYEQWKDWGDARIQNNPVVLDYFRTQVAGPEFLHAADAADTGRMLRLDETTPTKP